MQKKSTKIKSVYEDYYIVEEWFRPRYIILAIVFITIDNLSHFESIFFNRDLILIYVITSFYITKLLKIYKSVYLFLSRIGVDSLGLVVKIADTLIVASFTSS